MSMENILPEPEGSEITTFACMEYQPWKHRNSGTDDVLFIVYKDAQHVKKVRAIKNPAMDIYFVKPEYRTGFTTPREYMEIDKLYSKHVGARDVIKCIRQEMEDDPSDITRIMKSIYSNAFSTGNRQSAKEILKWPFTLMSDMKVEDYYRVMLGYHYNQMRNHIIDKGYLDIEADILGKTSTEQAANLDTVNACTLIFNYDPNRKVKMKPQVFTLLLRDYKRYPQQEEFERNISSFIETLHKDLDHQEIEKGGKKRIIDFEADYHILFYDREADLITNIFAIINKFKPDTMSVWNIAYDIPKLAGRMQNLGLNYVDVMCDPDFPKDYRFVEMNIDNRAEIDIADRKTYIRMLSTTVWIDQMQSYAGMRKGRKAYGSNKLDNIAKIELGVGKHTFDKGIDVTNAAQKDYYNFVYYNIIDVMRQVFIDMVTNDCMAMIYDMNQANCTIENLFKQTRYQKQIYYTWYLRKGFVPGNNPNVNYIRGESEDYLERLEDIRAAREMRRQLDQADNIEIDEDGEIVDDEDGAIFEDLKSSIEDEEQEEYDEKTQEIAELVAGNVLSIYEDSVDRKLALPGGMVLSPDFNSANGAELVKGIRSKHVFDDVMDMDYASEYPWAKYTRSLSKSTQIGRLIIPHRISDKQNYLPLGQEKRIEEINAYLPGAEFVEDYISHDIFSFGNCWFNLPTVTEMDELLMKKLGKGKDKDHDVDGFYVLRRKERV